MSVYDRILERQEHLKLICSQEQLASFALSSQAGTKELELLISYLDLVSANKRARSIEMLQKCSKIPVIKSLKDFDFSFQPSINESQIRSFATLGFMNKAENIIFIGDPGTGKSHLAISQAELAITEGRKVYYITMSDLIAKIDTAFQTGKIERLFRTMRLPGLLVIDEIGYRKLSLEETEVFFSIISNRYERASTILTSNYPLSLWDSIFSSKAMTSVIIDRLLHHGHVVKIRGKSYRLKDKILQDPVPHGESGGKN
jgi:DNA replication protein DnaC